MTTPNGRGELRYRLGALALFAALAVVHTWPLASAPGRLSRNDNGDAVLNEWIMAWVVHQAVADPVHLFDANIFYPERRTLAYSENLLPESVMAAPLLWLGASPVLAHNVVFLLGMILTGWVTALVVARWTGSGAGGLVAGSLAAFNAHTLTKLVHIQSQHIEFLPIVLLALDRLLTWPRARHAITLGAAFALQSLASTYFLVFSATAIVCSTAVRPRDWAWSRLRRLVPHALLACGVAAVLLVPFLLPYATVRRTVGLVRELPEVAMFSAQLGDYLATGSRVHFDVWSSRFFRADALFPGIIAMALAAVSLYSGVAWRDVRARMALASGAVAFCLSFGPQFPPYTFLYQAIPLLQSIRGVARFGHLTLFAIAVLAGFGMAEISRRITSRRMQAGVAAAAIALCGLEALRAPLRYQDTAPIPPIYARLASEPHAVVAHFPFYDQRTVFANTRYMLASTLHWHPMLNGYSGFIPAVYGQHVAALRAFPRPETLAYLRAMGVTHVVVDTAALSRPRVELLEQADRLSLVATDGVIRIYRLVR